MKSRVNSTPIFVVPPNVESNAGPALTISSAVFESSNGFLKRMSVLQSVVPEPKSRPVPISISSQSLIGVNSTATVGPPLAALGVVPTSCAVDFKDSDRFFFFGLRSGGERDGRR